MSKTSRIVWVIVAILGLSTIKWMIFRLGLGQEPDSIIDLFSDIFTGLIFIVVLAILGLFKGQNN